MPRDREILWVLASLMSVSLRFVFGAQNHYRPTGMSCVHIYVGSITVNCMFSANWFHQTEIQYESQV